MERYSIFVNWKVQQCEEIDYPQVNLQAQRIPRNLNRFLLCVEIDELMLQFTRKCKRPGTTKTILKKNKDGELVLPDMKTY